MYIQFLAFFANLTCVNQYLGDIHCFPHLKKKRRFALPWCIYVVTHCMICQNASHSDIFSPFISFMPFFVTDLKEYLFIFCSLFILDKSVPCVRRCTYLISCFLAITYHPACKYIFPLHFLSFTFIFLHFLLDYTFHIFSLAYLEG